MSDSRVFNNSDDFRPMPLPGGVVPGEDAEKLTPVPFQFSDIRALAARILKRAQEQAEQKLAAARSQIAEMEKAARDKAYGDAFPKGEQAGFAKGEKEAKAAGEAEVRRRLDDELAAFRTETEPVGKMLAGLMNSVNEHRQFLAAQAEADLLLLSVDIARRIVGHELSFDPEAIRPLAVEAIGLVAERSNIRMRVNPDDLAVMEKELPDLRATFPDLGAVRLEADPAIERGGLVAATREAEVDMRLATRLAAFEEAILGFSGKEAQAPWSIISPRFAPPAEAAPAIPPQHAPAPTDLPDNPEQPPGAAQPSAEAASARTAEGAKGSAPIPPEPDVPQAEPDTPDSPASKAVPPDDAILDAESNRRRTEIFGAADTEA